MLVSHSIIFAEYNKLCNCLPDFFSFVYRFDPKKTIDNLQQL